MLATSSPPSALSDSSAAALRRTGFCVEVDERGATTVIRLFGELDMAGGGALHAALRQALAGGASSIVLDLTELSFVDSAGLSLFLGARNHAMTQRKTLTLRNPDRDGAEGPAPGRRGPAHAHRGRLSRKDGPQPSCGAGARQDRSGAYAEWLERLLEQEIDVAVPARAPG